MSTSSSIRFSLIQLSYGLALGVLVVLLSLGVAMAGTGGAEFAALETLVAGWTQGALGRSLALIACLVGAGIGVVRGGVMGMVSGLAIAVGLSVIVGVVSGILTATI